MIIEPNREYSPIWAIWAALIALSIAESVYANDAAPNPVSPQVGQSGVNFPGVLNSVPSSVTNLPPAVQLGSQGEFPWSGSDSKDCGQSCLQHKSAEELALMTMYQLQVTSKVQDLKLDQKDSQYQTDKPIFNEITNGFCNSGEDDQVCRKRFLDYQYSYLLELRKAEADNKVNAGKYMSQSGALHFSKTKEANEKPKRAQVPYVATVSDLEIEFKKHEKLKKSDFDDWQKKVHNPRDDKEFGAYENKDTDSKKKEAGRIMVPVMDGDHQRVNKDEFESAKTKHQNFYVNDDVKKQIKAFKTRTDLHTKAVDPRTTKLQDAAQKERVKLYNEARSKVVNTVNDAIFGAGIKTTVNFSTLKSSVQLKKNQHIDIESKDDKRTPANVTVTGDEKVLTVEPSQDNEDSFVTIGWDPQKLQKQIDGIAY